MDPPQKKSGPRDHIWPQILPHIRIASVLFSMLFQSKLKDVEKRLSPRWAYRAYHIFKKHNIEPRIRSIRRNDSGDVMRNRRPKTLAHCRVLFPS